jgi:hypothetical protein
MTHYSAGKSSMMVYLFPRPVKTATAEPAIPVQVENQRPFENLSLRMDNTFGQFELTGSLMGG